MTQQEFDLLYSGGIDAQTALTLLMGKETIVPEISLPVLRGRKLRTSPVRFKKSECGSGLSRGAHAERHGCLYRSFPRFGNRRFADGQLRPVRTGHPDLNEIRPETELLGRRIAEACRVIEELKNLTET